MLIEGDLEKGLLISLKKGWSVEEVLRETKFQAILEYREENYDMMMVEWTTFLAGQFPSNIDKVKPVIKIKKSEYTIKFAKIKRLPTQAQEFYRQKYLLCYSRLKYMTGVVKNLEYACLNQVDQLLLQGIIKEKTWKEVEEDLAWLVEHMNTRER